MPLLDHLHAPLKTRRHWEGFHSAWATAIAAAIHRELPPDYFAEPTVDWGRAEVSRGGAPDAADATWTPAAPTQRIALDFGRVHAVEIRVYSEFEGPRLVAAIELVSPANKDREASRRAFSTRCASYLVAGVSVDLVDIVTNRRADMEAEVLRALGVERKPEPEGRLAASALRRISVDDDGSTLELWSDPVAVGAPLPVLPLWIAHDVPRAVDLEATHDSTCRTLRIAP